MRKILLVFIGILAFISTSYSQKIIDYNINNNILRINCSEVDFEIQAYTENIIKITSFFLEDHMNDTSYVVQIQEEHDLVVDINVEEDKFVYRTDSLELHIPRDAFGIEFIKDGKVVAKHRKNGFVRAYETHGNFFDIEEDEGIYGLGSKSIDINRRNLTTVMYNQNMFGYEFGDHWINTNIPFIVSSKYYGLFFDNHCIHYVDIDKKGKNTIRYLAHTGQFKYFFISGYSYETVINRYTNLTGKQPLLPRWALGFFLSKISFQDQDKCVNTANRMIDLGFPMDAMIFDYSWFAYAENMGNFSWDKDKYPDPPKMISDLKNFGIKSILISEPYIATTSKNFQEAKDKKLLIPDTDGNIPTTKILGSEQALFDISLKTTQNWIWDRYQSRYDDGIEGWWIDLIEPEFHSANWILDIGPSREVHNIYSYLWAENLFSNYQKVYPNKRAFFMFRAGWAGIQKHSVVFQPGDENRTWAGLKGQIPVLLGLQMSGASLVGTDIGGFAGDYEMKQELYARWFQFGTFNPIMRLHMGGTNRVEPFHYSKEIQDIAREYVKLRYKLLPYNYTLMWENSAFARPMARPMNYYENEEIKFRNCNDQYFWGENFLLAPVIDSNKVEREVLLPSGDWIDYWTKEKFEGSKTVMVDAPLETLPLFIKSGAIIPCAHDMQSTDNYKADSLIIEFYPDKDAKSSYTLYNDNGKSLDSYSSGEYQLINFEANTTNDSIQIIQSSSGSYKEMPESIDLYYKIYNIDFGNHTVILNGIMLTQYSDEIYCKLNNNSYCYDQEKNCLYIHFTYFNDDTDLIIYNRPNIIKEPKTPSLLVYPVPSEKFLNIKCKVFEPGQYSANVFDSEGRLIGKRFDFIINDRNETLKFDIAEDFKVKNDGYYYLRIFDNTYSMIFKFLYIR